jgi:hypothetical protein
MAHKRGDTPEDPDVLDRNLERMLDSSRLQSGMSADTGWNRRRLLRTMTTGAGLVAAAGALDLLSPADALAATSGTFWDQGGAVFNVMAYGADSTGGTNSATAIGNAITAAQSAGGGVVYFPAGTFLINSGLTVTANGITLQGAGTGATTIKAGSSFTTGDMIYFNQVQYGRVRDLTISSVNARTSGNAINLYGVNQGATDPVPPGGHLVENVSFNKQFQGIYINGQMFLCYINRVYMGNITAGGVGINLNAVGSTGAFGESHYISNVFIQGNSGPVADMPAAGIQIQSTGDFTLRSVSLVLCQVGLLINPSSGNYAEAGFIEGCLWDSCGTRCIEIEPASGATARWITFVDNWIVNAGTYDGLFIAGGSQINVIGCRLYFSQSYGLIVNGGTEIFVDNCEASGNSQHTAYDAAGIAFAMNASYFAVRNCFTNGAWTYGNTNTQGYGIEVFSGCDNFIIANNLAVNNTTAQLSIASSTNQVVANNLTT